MTVEERLAFASKKLKKHDIDSPIEMNFTSSGTIELSVWDNEQQELLFYGE